MNIVNIIDYVAYIRNTLFLDFTYAPYPEFSVFNDKSYRFMETSLPQRLIMLKNYVSIYTLCSACEAERMLETLSFQKLNFPIDFYSLHITSYLIFQMSFKYCSFLCDLNPIWSKTKPTTA